MKINDIIEYAENVMKYTDGVTYEGFIDDKLIYYANIVAETLYDTAVNGIPALYEQVKRYLAETDWDVWEAGEDMFEKTESE